MKFVLKPVAWLTAIASLAAALPPILLNNHLVSEKVAGYITLVGLFATVLVGVVTHGIVTPLAAPKDNSGTPLVPAEQPVSPREG